MELNQEREIFVSALRLGSAGERIAYLQQACGGSAELFGRIKALLEASDIQDDFLKTPVLDSRPTLDSSTIIEEPGTVIGRYKLLEKIGEGGMAVVYMAEQEKPIRRKVALKIIKLGMDTRGVIARFEAERQALALMDHPNIAKVLDAGATETGRPYFVMELVKGVPITEYCDKNKLTTLERLRLFIQVCQAVQHAHQKGIIHRDIKPTNILVTLHDGTPVPKVIDFGIAKATEYRLTDKTLFTRFHAFIGTPAYMSPEQARMSGLDVDTRTDIYALGVLLYELLTGKTPFDPEELLRTGLDECRRTICEKEPDRPSTRVATLIGSELTTTAEHRRTESARLIHMLRADLDWIVMKCLEKDRARRYETANALAVDLRRYLDGEPILARSPSTVYRMRKFIRRNKPVVAVAAVLVIAAVTSSWQAVRATRAEREQNRLRAVAQEAQANETTQRQRAEAEELAALRRAYNSEMNLVQQALAANNYGRVVALLDRHRPNAGDPDFRQWEWRYYWGQSRSEAAFALPQQADPIEAVAVSPNGRLLASADRRGALKLWDLDRQTEVAAIQERGFGSRAFTFSHDGSRLAATVNEDWRRSLVKVWTVAGRQVIAELPCEGGVQSLVFGPDDASLLILDQDTAVRIWDFERQQVETVLAGSRSQGRPQRPEVAFSPDARMAAIAEGGRIRLLDLAAGAETVSFDAFEQDVAAIAFSPDGEILAASPLFTETSTDIRLFATASGDQIGQLAGHVSWIPDLAFTSDGERLISGSADQTIRLWDLQEQRQVASFQGHLSEIYCVAAAPDGKTIVSGCKDGTLLGWHVDKIKPRKRFDTLPVPVATLDFLPERQGMLSVNMDGTVTLWDAETLQEKEPILALGDKVHRLLISPEGTRVFAGTRTGELKVLDWATRLVVTNLSLVSGRHSVVTPTGFVDRGRTLVVAGGDSMIRLLDTQSWQARAEWKAGEIKHWFRAEPVISADERFLLIAGFGGAINNLDLANGKVETGPAVEEWGASDMALSPDGRLLAVASLEGTVSIWDASTWEVVGTMRGHLLGVGAIAFSPDGQRLASASHGDEAVKLWDVATGHEVATLAGEGLISNHLKFSPDGERLVAVNMKGKAHIWCAPSFDEIAAVETPSGPESDVPRKAATKASL